MVLIRIWWNVGPRCETRWLNVPYKPLSQRMLEEPFWLGLMTITVVLAVITLVWCIKRHFAEKFERFVNEEMERGKLVEPASIYDWNRGRNASRSSLEPIAISRPCSPQNGINVSCSASTNTKDFSGFFVIKKKKFCDSSGLFRFYQLRLFCVM